MTTLSERNFHIVMGTLLLGSTFLDRVMRNTMPSWNAPEVSLPTLVLGMVWVGLFAAYRGKNLEDQMRVLQDRLERAQNKIEALEVELVERKRPLI